VENEDTASERIAILEQREKTKKFISTVALNINCRNFTSKVENAQASSGQSYPVQSMRRGNPFQ
jgi:hypothetical protein